MIALKEVTYNDTVQIQNNYRKLSSRDSKQFTMPGLFSYKKQIGSSSGLYSGGFTWSIVLKCDDQTGIFTCDGCARDPYFYVPAETQSYVIKLSCSRKALAASGD